jgi:hypothetical protein
MLCAFDGSSNGIKSDFVYFPQRTKDVDRKDIVEGKACVTRVGTL